MTSPVGAPAPGNGLRDESELYRLVVEAAPDAMLLVAGDDRISLVNTRTEQIFGYPRASLIGQPFSMLVPERCRATLQALLARPGATPLPALGVPIT